MAEPAAEKPGMKEQRDRFLAFSFASADMFIEVSEEGRVTHALGAAQAVTGIDHKKLVGKKWLELFSVYEQARMIELYENAKPGKRQGPMLVNLSDALGARKAIMTAIRMPDSGKFYLTMGLSSAMMARIAHAIGDGKFEILGRDEFIGAALAAYARAKSTGQEIFMTVFDFAPTGLARKRMGEPPWKKLRETIGECLISASTDSYAAGEVLDGRFVTIHDKSAEPQALAEKVTALSKQADPAGEGVQIKSKSLPVDFKTIGERELEKGVAHAINDFYARGADALKFATINAAYEAYLMANNSQIKELKGIIERTGFAMHYQPVVDLKSCEPRYYEMLCRFEKGDTREWIKFAEDTGLISDFDMAVCERAINHVKFKAGNSRTKFSLNLSSQSAENSEFVEKLMEKLAKEKALAERLIFEISNSSYIRDMNKIESFTKKLQDLGFHVTLDNLRDGANMSDLLNRLHPNSVKIDAHHIKALLTAQRDTSIVKNIIDSCKPLKIEVIGVAVEDKGQASVLFEQGAVAAQGHYFGKPGIKIEYAPPRDWP